MAKVILVQHDREKDGPFFGTGAGPACVLTGWNSREDLLSGKAFEAEQQQSQSASASSEMDSSANQEAFESWMQQQGLERPEGFEAQTALLMQWHHSTASQEKAPSASPATATPKPATLIDAEVLGPGDADNSTRNAQ
jgi:hypothetical protein